MTLREMPLTALDGVVEKFKQEWAGKVSKVFRGRGMPDDGFFPITPVIHMVALTDETLPFPSEVEIEGLMVPVWVHKPSDKK